MFMKSYTAIIQRGEEIKAVDMMVAPGNENESILKEEYPDYSLVALVPGQHARWSRVFCANGNTVAQRKIYSASGGSIDLWDTNKLVSGD